MRTLLFILLIFAVAPAQAQQQARARIEGRIVDAETLEPLEHVHVFVSRSETGTVSGADGRFVFTVPLGAHRIVVSRVGHRTQTHDVMVRAPRSYRLDFLLEQDVMELEGIDVAAERDPDWDRHLATFLEFFLGATRNAASVEVTNPEVLDFSKAGDALYAWSDAPLLLVNRALGYRIEHHLHEFILNGEETWHDGESFFEEMTPASDDEARLWADNRARAFLGSAHHFFSSLMQDRTRQEGFLVYRVENPGFVGRQSEYRRNTIAPMRGAPQFAVNPVIYLHEGESAQERSLAFPDYLHIIYTREDEDRAYAQWQRLEHSGQTRDMQYSWIRLHDGPSTLDLSGNVLDPYSIMYFGYMSFERMADMLPKEYRPDRP